MSLSAKDLVDRLVKELGISRSKAQRAIQISLDRGDTRLGDNLHIELRPGPRHIPNYLKGEPNE